MRIELKNIAMVEEASIEIDGITVIAGENNTGKSTIGRAVFSVFNSFLDVPSRMVQERISSLTGRLGSLLLNSGNSYLPRDVSIAEQVATEVVDNIEEFKLLSEDDLYKRIVTLFQRLGINHWDAEDASNNASIKAILDILQISDNDFLRIVLERRLNVEFANQVGNIFSNNTESSIAIEIQDHLIRVDLLGNKVREIYNPDNFSLNSEVIYIDDPFVLDDSSADWMVGRAGGFLSNYFHRMHLINKIASFEHDVNVFEDIDAHQKLDRIFEKISSVCRGDIVTTDASVVANYRVAGQDKLLRASNLSAGLKAFALLKSLLKGGGIRYNGFVILDEPEVHLHPKWQLVFAEVVVLLHKDFGVNVLLNTHSPYFLRAIQVFANKHDVSDKCKYYKATSDVNLAKFSLVEGDLSSIYVDLWEPFQSLEDVYWD